MNPARLELPRNGIDDRLGAARDEHHLEITLSGVRAEDLGDIDRAAFRHAKIQQENARSQKRSSGMCDGQKIGGRKAAGGKRLDKFVRIFKVVVADQYLRLLGTVMVKSEIVHGHPTKVGVRQLTSKTRTSVTPSARPKAASVSSTGASSGAIRLAIKGLRTARSPLMRGTLGEREKLVLTTENGVAPPFGTDLTVPASMSVWVKSRLAGPDDATLTPPPMVTAIPSSVTNGAAVGVA